MSKKHVGYRHLMAQVDYLFNIPYVADQADEIRKVIVSNNGSVLDENTFSTTALIYLVAMINSHLPNLDVLTLESRPEHVDWEELELISRAMHEGSMNTLEIAVGFEIFDDHLRNRVFQKGLSKERFERFVVTVQEHSAVKEHDYAIKVYFMLKPVEGMTDEQAIRDIHNAIDYLSSLERQMDVEINLHLNPTFVAAGTALQTAFEDDQYNPPTLRDLAQAALRAKDGPLTVFLGLNDEGLAVKGGSFIRPGDEPVLERLAKFNATQDYDILKEVAYG
jgi:radical SAM enzyme (TIGR01210 family)